MSRKANRSANALTSIAADALSFSDSSRNRHPQTNQHSHHERFHKDKISGTPHTQGHNDIPGEGSPYSSSTTENGVSDFGDSESANGDDADDVDDENSKDAAAIAPPDHAFGEQQDQVGLSTANYASFFRLAHTAPILGQAGETLEAAGRSAGNNERQEDDDDGDYNAVDLISESDGEDPNIEQLEEANILDELTASDDLGDLSMFSDGSVFPGDMPYFEEQMRRMEQSDLSAHFQLSKSPEMWNSFPSAPSPPPPTPTTATRRVHFDASALTSRSSISLEPDSQLVSKSFDFDDDDSLFGSMSGYESDGETTDQDEIPPYTIKSPRALFRQPSLSLDSPRSPTLSRCSRNVGFRPPRMGSFVVNSSKAIAQCDKEYNIVIIEAVKPKIVNKIPGNRGEKTPTPAVTGCLMKKARAPDPVVDALSFTFEDPYIPDPVLGTGTNAAMENMMGGIINDEGRPSQPQPPSSTFMPATDLLDELRFVAPNSDQESSDIDIMDYMTFSDDSDDEAAKENLQTKSGANETLQDMERPTEISAPLMTPAASQTSPSTLDEPLKHFRPGLAGGFRRGLPKPKTPAPLRRPHSGLALTRPATRGSNRHTNNTPAKFEKKRKLSDTFASSSKRPNLKRKLSNHQ